MLAPTRFTKAQSGASRRISLATPLQAFFVSAFLVGLGAPTAVAQEAAEAAAPLAAAPLAAVNLTPIPDVSLEAMDSSVRTVIEARRQQLEPRLADLSTQEARQIAGEGFGELGFLYQAHDLPQLALVCFQNAGLLRPEDPRWSYASALAYKAMGNLDGAAEQYELNLERLPGNSTALIGLAEVRLDQNMPLVAKALLNHALSLSAESPAALALLGQVALSQKKYQRAITFFERALGQVPDANRLHYPMALAYRALGDTDKAREHLAKRGDVGVRAPDPIRDQIEARKTGERVLLLEGRRAFAVKRYEEAAALFQKALQAKPDSIRARVNLGTALGAAGKTDQAVTVFERVLEMEPENAAAAFNLGSIALQRGEVERAKDWLTVAVASDENDAESRKLLAKAYQKLGNLTESLRWTQEAARLNGADQELWLMGSELNRVLGNHGEALRWLEEGARALPDQGLLLHALARHLATSPALETRDGERAVTLATRVANATGDLEHWYTVVQALGEAGRCEDAASLVEQMMEKVTEEGRQRLQPDLDKYRQGAPCRP